MIRPNKEIKENQEVSEQQSDLKLDAKDKKTLARWVGERLLESNEKIDKTLEELGHICEKATQK